MPPVLLFSAYGLTEPDMRRIMGSSENKEEVLCSITKEHWN